MEGGWYVFEESDTNIIKQDNSGLRYHLHQHPFMHIRNIERFEVIRLPDTSLESEVMLQLDNKGTRQFAEYTRHHIGEDVALVINNQILAAPTISEVIHHGKLYLQLKGWGNNNLFLLKDSFEAQRLR